MFLALRLMAIPAFDLSDFPLFEESLFEAVNIARAVPGVKRYFPAVFTEPYKLLYNVLHTFFNCKPYFKPICLYCQPKHKSKVGGPSLEVIT